MAVFDFVLAGGFLIISAILRGDAKDGSDITENHLPWRRWEKWFMGFLAGYFVFSHAYKIGSLPEGANDVEGKITEAIYSLQVLPYTAHWGGDVMFPTLSYYQAWLCARLFGHDVGILRLPSVFWGLLLVLLFYLLARRIASPGSAALCSLLLAGDPYTLHMSRWLFPGILTMVPAVGGFYFLYRGLQTSRKTFFALGGLLTGLGLHGYVPGRLVPVLIFAWLAWLFLIRRPVILKNIKYLGLFWGVALATAWPVIQWAIHNPGTYWRVIGRVLPAPIVHKAGVGTFVSEFFRETLPYLGMFHLQGDPDPGMQIIGEPVFGPVVNLLFPIGLIYALAFFWRPVYSYLLAAFLCGFVPAILAEGFLHPTTRRVLIVIPLAYLFAALAVHRLWGGLGSRLGRPGRIMLIATGLGMVVWANVEGLNRYYVRWCKDPATLYHSGHHFYHAGKIMSRYPQAKRFLAPYLMPFETRLEYPLYPWEGWPEKARDLMFFNFLDDLWKLDTHFENLVFVDPVFAADLDLIQKFLDPDEIYLKKLTWEKQDCRWHLLPDKFGLGYAEDYSEWAHDLLALYFGPQNISKVLGVRFYNNEVGSSPRKVALSDLRETLLKSEGRRIHLKFGLLLPPGKLNIEMASRLQGLTLNIDGSQWSGDKGRVLNGGWHLAELQGVLQGVPPSGAPIRVDLTVGDKILAYDVRKAIFPLDKLTGLLASFYPDSGNWDGRPRYSQVTLSPRYPVRERGIPGIADMKPPFGIRFSGSIQVPEAGEYRFTNRQFMSQHIEVDGRRVYASVPWSEQEQLWFKMEPNRPSRLQIYYSALVVQQCETTFDLWLERKGDPRPFPVPSDWLSPDPNRF